MAATTESNRNTEVLLSEANGNLSRETVTLVSGAGALKAGTVLGKITASGKYTSYDDDNLDGSETAAAILLYDTDATAADVSASVLFRLAEVKTDRVVWAATNDAGDKTAGIADLAAKFIILR
jgi:hypothetical protein